MDQGDYTIKQAAKILKCSDQTIRRKIRSGELPAVQVEGLYGPTYMIRAEDINRAAAIVTEIVKIDKALSLDQLAGRIEQVFAARDGTLIDKIDDQANEIRQLHDELTKIRQLLEGAEIIEQSPPQLSWWGKLFKK